MPTGFRGRMRPLLAVVAAAMLAACAQDALAPGPAIGPSPTAAAVPLSPTFSVAHGIGGSYSMPAGGTEIASVPLGPTGITLPAGTPVRVVIGGAITRTPTEGLLRFCALPAYAWKCESAWADLVSDAPIPPSGIWGTYGRAFASWDGAAPGAMDESDEGDLSLSGSSGTEVYAGRAGWQCFYQIRVLNPDGTLYSELGPCHDFGGGYTVAVRPQDGGGALTLTASRTGLPVGGGSVTFTAATSDGSTPENITWSFVEDAHAAAQPMALRAAQEDPIAAGRAAVERGEAYVVASDGRLARGHPEDGGLYLVETKPAASARPHSTAAPGAALAFIGANAMAAASINTAACAGDVACTVSVTSGGTMVVRARVNGQELAATARVDIESGAGGAEELQLSCPPTAVRGTEIVCAASASPGSARLEVTGWRFHGDESALADIVRPSDQLDLTWRGKMVSSGTVTVYATLDGNPAQKSAHVQVSSRAPLTVSFTAPMMTDNPDMSENPYQVPGERGLVHIGHTHTADHAIRIPGNVDVVPSGPNAGLAYFTGNPYEPRWAIHVNLSQLQPTSELGRRQRTSLPAFERVRSCLPSDLPALVGPVAEHEGTTMHPQSHAARYAAKFNEYAGLAIERLVVQQGDLVAAAATALAPAIQAAGQESDKADSDFRPALCRLDLFPPPAQ